MNDMIGLKSSDLKQPECGHCDCGVRAKPCLGCLVSSSS